MKKLFSFIVLTLTLSVAHAQDFTVENSCLKATKIFENTNLNAEQTYQQMTLFFGSFFNNVNKACVVNTPTKLLYKFDGEVAQIAKGLGFYHTFYASLELEVSIKDNRMRVVISCDKIDTPDMHPYDGYNPAINFPATNEHDVWTSGVTKKQAQTIFDGTIFFMTKTIEKIEKALQEYSADDEW